MSFYGPVSQRLKVSVPSVCTCSDVGRPGPHLFFLSPITMTLTGGINDRAEPCSYSGHRDLLKAIGHCWGSGNENLPYIWFIALPPSVDGGPKTGLPRQIITQRLNLRVLSLWPGWARIFTGVTKSHCSVPCIVSAPFHGLQVKEDSASASMVHLPDGFRSFSEVPRTVRTAKTGQERKALGWG